MMPRLDQLGIVSRFGEFPRLGSGRGRKGTKRVELEHWGSLFPSNPTPVLRSFNVTKSQAPRKPMNNLYEMNEISETLYIYVIPSIIHAIHVIHHSIYLYKCSESKYSI